jgi:O-acetyl-ADP-ribose deacetylase (regulator of RNase III)
LIRYEVGDATEPPVGGGGVRVICHVCNDVGAWGAGFVLALSRRWQEPENVYRASFDRHRRLKPQLGEVQLMRVEAGLYVANMIAQRGLRSSERPVALDYTALANCLTWLAQYAESDWSFHMPRIGCGLAGGHWGAVAKIVGSTIGVHHDVTVYDQPAGRL